MSNRVSYCKDCKKKTVKSIYYRHENRSFRVAFSICENCGIFFNFNDWEHQRRIMPYFNDIGGLLRGRFMKGEKRAKMFFMRKDPNAQCIKGKNHEHSKLYVKDDSQTPHFVGYLCKECRVAYFVKTEFLVLNPDERGSLGSHATTIDYKESEPEIIEKHYRLTKKDAKKLEKVLKRLEIKLH